MTEHRSPLDAALDLVVYAPLGLALTIGEELPKLAAKGRSTFTGRVQAARVVGQFAVAQGRQEVQRRIGSDAGPAARATTPGGPAAPPSSRPGGPPPAGAAGRPASAKATAPAVGGPAPDHASNGNGEPAPAVDSLGIPGYDSLSASQVVARLGGLSPDELGAVQRYEAANRGRRTILARITQLQGQ